MKKGILLFVALTMFYFVADAQSVFVDIQESDGGCGLQTDCESNIACFDLIVTIDQADWELASYNVWTQYPAPPLMSHSYDNACLTQNGGDTDDNINGQYRVAGINGVDVLVPNTPTVFHTICYDYSDESLITDSVIASGGTLNLYGTPFFSTMTLSHTVTGVSAGLTIPQQYFLDLNESTFSCLAPDVLIEKAMIANADNDGSGSITVGDVLTYRVKASNAGSIDLNNVLVNDPKLSPQSTLCTLLPAGDSCVLIGTYTVQPADVNAGEIINTATVVSDEVGPFEVTITTPVPNNPETSIEKTLLTDISGGVEAGDVLNYSVNVTNTGDMTLTNVVVNDPKLTPNSISCGFVLPGASCTLSGFYAVKQSDINSGEIMNIASGNSDQTPEVIDTLTTTLPQTPDLTIEKSLISDTTGGIQVGEALIYYIEIVNIGNITLNDVTISDPKLTPNTKICPTVAPNGICSLTGTYTVKQSDVNAGQVVNNATGSSNETPPKPVQLIIPITQNPETTTVKTLLTDISGGVAEGDVLDYEIVVTNTGNITLHNVSVSDPVLTPDLATCDSLVPGAACTLTGTYTLSQDDVDDGEFENIGTGDSDETDPDPDTLITPLPQNPELLVEKSTPDSTYFEIGQVINYTIEVTNTGNVTIDNITLSDPEADAGTIACTATELLPGESLTCTAIHTVDQDDMFAGEVINIATANGDDPLGNLVSQPSNEVVVSIQIILANDDTGTPVDGFDGGEAVPNVLANDLLSGLPVDPADVILTEVSSDDPAISLDPLTGAVNVDPGTPAGTYELVYQICVSLNPANCDQATVTATVEAPEIIANDDMGTPINGYVGGEALPNVLVNDLLNGDPVDPNDITLAQISSTHPGVSLDPLTGAVNVAAGTPAGNYELVYEICDNVNPTNCDQALVTVPVTTPEIIANDDPGTPVNGFDGGVVVPDVLANDLLNGDPVDPNDITLSEVSSEDPGVSLNPLTGEVNVAPGTPAGNYELVYEICEILNPSNCDQATVFVPVTAPEIIANDDMGTPVNGFDGGEAVPNVLDNDLLNGDPVDPNDITLAEISSEDPGVSLDPLTGAVNVAPGTPAGNYELVYEICEILNPTNCDQATVTVSVTAPEIIANDDTGTPVNGFDGGEAVPNVLVNDLLNGDPVDPADITLAEISSEDPGVSLDPLTGAVNVAPGTPAGNYDLVYEICEILNPTNCDQATVTVPVEAPEIIANDDTGTPVNGYVGGESFANVLVNDLLNGDPVDPNDIDLAQISSTHPGVSLDPLTGAVNVAPGTPAGNYELVYEICEILNPSNCDQATVTVPVEAPEIIASDDTGTPVNGLEGGEAVPNVLVNDLLNGDPVDPNDITLAEISSEDPGVSLDPLTGAVNVAPGTPAGNYELVYEICEILNPTNCDQATVTVTVEAPEIIANDDMGTPINGYVGGEALPNVLVNDLLNGDPIDPADITLAEISSTHPGVSLDPLTGAVNVAAGTPAGNYELVYEICEILNPTNCDQATVFVEVTFTSIVAVDDFGVDINGMNGGVSLANVLANDELGGLPVIPAEITLEQISTSNPNVSLNPLTGEVNVAPGTPAGNYELVYEICEILNPSNCDQATVFVPVTAPEIIANDDMGTPVNGFDGGEAVPNVLDNDLLNGDPVDPNDITLAEISSEDPGVSLDPLTGAVNVAPGTPAGNYELVYEICEILNPTNCDQATVTVSVTAPEIIANDDTGTPVNGFDGGEAVPNVLVNDLLNGDPVDPADITLAEISSEDPGVSLDPLTGAVNVAPGTPAGNYDLVYEICEILNPTNCDQATVTVPVEAPEIIANDDTGTPVNGYVGGESFANVLVNDLLNGDPVDPNDIDLAQISSTHPGVSLDPLTGAVNVAPGTPAGNYELVYEICEILNPSNCDQATVTVPVEAPEIIASDDTGTPVNGLEGGEAVPNVLVNDLLNGDPVDPNDITLAEISSEDPGVSLDPLTGAVNVAPGTPAGNYELVYEICEILNPTNCDQATVTVTVEAPEIIANDDMGTPINGYVGGEALPNVLVNDLLNGDPIDPADITLAEISSTHPGVSLDPLTGAVNVAAGTPAGNYELVYEICEILNPTNCDQATVFVEVTFTSIVAVDDFGVDINGMNGGVSLANVLANDELGGLPVIPAEITLEQISTSNPNVSLNPLTGEVNVAPGTPAGNYELVYEICEILNPSNCDQATVFVPVTAPEIIANDDMGTPVNGFDGGEAVPNVLDNDLLNGDPVDPNDITLAEISSEDPGVSLDPLTGAVNVAPGTPAGNYELVYEICEILNPTNCDQATVTVSVTAPEIIANDDTGTPVNGFDGGEAVPNVLVNDLLNGDPVDPADITLAEISSEDPGVSLDPLTGAVNVAPGTPAGNYDLVYEICEILNPTNCDQATVTVPVEAPEIIANDDTGTPVNGYVGGESFANVLVNDLLNGDPVDPNDIDLAQISSTHPGVSLDPLTGAVNVAPGTPAGNYELVYEICEILNPSNCDQATVTVPVEAPEIIASDDTGTPVNGLEGGEAVPNVLVNDLLNGDPVDPNDITLAEISSEDPGVSLDPLTGAVNVAPGTPAGNYELVYEICEILNPTNCDQATVTVMVFEEPDATFCFNNEEAQTGSAMFFCSTESIALTLCDLASGQAPLTICWEVEGVPDCELIVYVGDTLFIEFFTPGDYEVNITSITDNLGNSVADLGAYNFDVSVSEGPSANVGGNNTICQGTNQVFDAASALSFSSLSWTGGDGIFVPSNEVLNPMYIPGAQDIIDGTVDLCLTALPLTPCNTAFVDCMTLSILKNAVADAGVDISACETVGSVDIIGAAENGQNMFWSSTGTGFFTSENTPLTSYAFTADDVLAGSVDLCLTVVPISPCVIPANDCMTLTIIQAPESFAGADKSVCEGNSIVLNDGAVQNAQGVAWSTDGDGTFADVSSLITTYYPGNTDITIGDVQLCLTAQPMDGCTVGTESCLNLNIIKQPSSDLEPLLELVCADYDVDNGVWLPVDLSNTITGDYIAVEWTTNGDGTFDDANAVSPNYYPGLGDIWKGDIELCINIEAAGICQFNTSQCMMLYIPQQLIYFNKNGWWGISSYLETDLPTVPGVMDPLVLIPGSQHLVTMVDKAGSYFWPEATPPGGNLSEWMPIGYKIKMKNTPACLPIYGDSLADQSFLVNGSFTFLPVLSNVPVSVDSLLQGHFDDVVLIYHWAKNELWTPAASDFDFLYPGYAYLMVNRFGTIPYTVEYPDYVPDAPHLYPIQVTKQVINNSPWDDVQNTAQPHIFLFADNALAKMKPGDILGVFNESGECFGMAEYDDKAALYKLVAMGYNGFDSEDRGFLAGDEMQFKIYRQDDSEERDVTLIYDPDYPSSDGTFAVNGVSRVVDIVTTITAIDEQQSDSFMLNLYPNPASDVLNLVSDTKIVEVKIMNSSGQLVMQNTPNSTQLVLDVSHLSAGIYMIAVKNSHQQTAIQRVSIR